MLIKFKATDPRAGTVARMDSSRGQQLIDQGVADQVPEGAAAQPSPALLERARLDVALAELPDGYTDPDFVARAMRSHFREVFTDADEAKIRELVKAPASSLTSTDAGDISSTDVASTQPLAAEASTQPAESSMSAVADPASAMPAASSSADALATASTKSTRTRR